MHKIEQIIRDTLSYLDIPQPDKINIYIHPHPNFKTSYQPTISWDCIINEYRLGARVPSNNIKALRKSVAEQFIAHEIFVQERFFT
jgi:hypothetical protein